MTRVLLKFTTSLFKNLQLILLLVSSRIIFNDYFCWWQCFSFYWFVKGVFWEFYKQYSGNWRFRTHSFNSLLKSDAIRLARCGSSVIALRLYLTETFELQCRGNFVDLLKTCAVVFPFSLTNSVSRNFVGLTSKFYIFIIRT